MRYFQRFRRWVESLGPYSSLFLLLVPLAVVEPLKLATVFIAGDGHWLTGTITLLFAYAVSLLVTHGLFEIAKPKLLQLPWFAACWAWFVAVRVKLRRTLGLRPSADAIQR